MKRGLKILMPLLLACFIYSGLSSPAKASTSYKRLSGSSRYETAVEISKYGWPRGSETVVIATGADFPDALCAAPLANAYNAPILLSYPTSLDPKATNEIKRLGAKTAVIIGAQGVVGVNVENQLKALGVTDVRRLGGRDRYETSVKVAEALRLLKGDYQMAALTIGTNFPDALSMAPAASKRGMPILLTYGSSLPDSVRDFLDNREIAYTYIIGSSALISPEVDKALLGITNHTAANGEVPIHITRIWGRDRYETNAKIIETFKDYLDFEITYVATALNFPDALSGSALATSTSSPIILTDTTGQPSTQGIISSNFDDVMQFRVLGGEGAVSSSTLGSLGLTSNREGNSQANLANGGMHAGQGEWIFYSSEGDNNALYRVKNDGTGKSKIGADNFVSSINVMGNWIYYSGENAELVKIKTDGTGRQVLINSGVSYVYVNSDFIYYSQETTGGGKREKHLYRMKHDGSEKTKLLRLGDSENIYITKDSIYALLPHPTSFNYTLFKSDLNGGNLRNLIDDPVNHFNITRNILYYLDEENTIGYIKLGGNRGSMGANLAYINMKGMIASGKWIYFINANDNNTLYVSDLEGLYPMKMSPYSSTDLFSLVGDNIYSVGAEYDYTSSKTDGISTNRIINGKALYTKVVDGDIYYVNQTDNFNLYVLRKGESSPVNLHQRPAANFAIENGYIYYSNVDDGYKIYRMKTDGSMRSVVSSTPATELQVSNGWIYYSNIVDYTSMFGYLHKIKVDGTENTKLSTYPQPRNISVSGNYIYFHCSVLKDSLGNYYRGSSIYRVDKNTGIHEEIYRGAPIKTMQLSGDNLYFTKSFTPADEDPLQLHRLSTLTGQVSMVPGVRASYFTVTPDSIHFLNDDAGNGKYILKTDLNGNNLSRTPLLDGRGYSIVPDSGLIYYNSFTYKSSIYSCRIDWSINGIFD